MNPSFANIIVILLLVSASTVLEFFEEFKSNRAAEKLKELVATTCVVLRDGKELSVPMSEITIGDIVVLSAGSLVPADLRLLESKDLYISQSSLTGESEAVKKNENAILDFNNIDSISDLENICFMGTNVVSGYGNGVVIKIADDSYFGKIAHSVSFEKPKTTFQRGIESISKLLIKFMFIMIPITFLINAWKHNTVTAFTFAVAIAIGITPLLLPVILSSSLAKGAIRMSKKKTIVKKLDSIQSFGTMDILCTDKTGTLTEDKIVLEKYLDIKGEENISVLNSAFLNAYFQTGLKNNMDEAIIHRAEEVGISSIVDSYKKLNEIPFDFSRRRLSIVTESTDGEIKLITKGAVEEILSICSKMQYGTEISVLNRETKELAKKITKELNEKGLRVIAVCKKNLDSAPYSISAKDEYNMTLLGFIGFLDPPKESAKEAVAKLNQSGIRVIVLTGDNAEITRTVCEKLNIVTSKIVLGSQIDKLSDIAVLRLLRKVNVFAKLSPIQKARIVRILKESGNTVGYMGDGINDSPSLINSDVGISVDSAVPIAKETADIILLEKDLNILLDGVIEGRKTFANLLKYIKMAVSFNFGEVLSVLIASAFLPFLPITPIQLLVQSLLYDIGQLTLRFDNVDPEYLEKPCKWNIDSIKRFMFFMGPVSSLFDLIVFASLWFGFGLRAEDSSLFQSIWFSYGVVSNLVGLHIIRTAKLPFIQSNSSTMVYASSILLSIFAIVIPSTWLGKLIGLVPLSLSYILFILLIPLLYCIVALLVKRDYIKINKEWI